MDETEHLGQTVTERRSLLFNAKLELVPQKALHEFVLRLVRYCDRYCGVGEQRRLDRRVVGGFALSRDTALHADLGDGPLKELHLQYALVL